MEAALRQTSSKPFCWCPMSFGMRSGFDTNECAATSMPCKSYSTNSTLSGVDGDTSASVALFSLAKSSFADPARFGGRFAGW
jgi:hypothetical protein